MSLDHRDEEIFYGESETSEDEGAAGKQPALGLAPRSPVG